VDGDDARGERESGHGQLRWDESPWFARLVSSGWLCSALTLGVAEFIVRQVLHVDVDVDIRSVPW
jgi:hypothetical protein